MLILLLPINLLCLYALVMQLLYLSKLPRNWASAIAHLNLACP